MVCSRLLWWIFFFAANLGTGWATIAGAQDWPMLAHDPMRSGSTPHEIRPPFARKWYRIFPDEGIMAGVQPTAVAGRVYVPTMRGNLYAIDARTGKDLWRFQADGPILASPAVADERVFFTSADGSVYALADDGHLIWRFSTRLALWNSPVWIDDKILFGGRDGIVYAVESKSGRLLWTAKVGGPILASLAVDPRDERVYVACEDMRVYAFALADGQPLWKSEQLAGVSFRGYYPVIAPDGSVLVSVTPLYGQDEIQTIVLEAVREVFGD